MLQMNQIDQIKELQRQGLGPLEIASRLSLNRKTVAKYMKVEDFNGRAGGLAFQFFRYWLPRPEAPEPGNLALLVVQ